MLTNRFQSPVPGELNEALESYGSDRFHSDKYFLASSKRETVEKILNSNWGQWRDDLEGLPADDLGFPAPPDDSDFTLREKAFG